MKAIRDYKSFRQDGILEGIERGIKRGSVQKLISMVCKKMVQGKSPETIAEEMEEDKETIDRIYTVAGKYAPEYDVDKIYQEIYPE